MEGSRTGKTGVTRNALERVLARAAELQSTTGDTTEPSDTLSEQQIIELGQEVGLSPEHIRQALAEERVRIDPMELGGSGVAHQVLGPERVGSQRVVRGSPARVLEALDRWMQREQALGPVRQRADYVMWEPRRGLIPALSRAFAGKEHALGRANEVSATAVPLDREFTLVKIEASFMVLRRAMASQIAAGTVAGSGATGALVLMGVMGAVAVVPAVAIAGFAFYGARRTHRHATIRGQLAIEQALDILERGDGPQHRLIKMIESALPPGR